MMGFLSFFMYIFPAFFLAAPVTRLTPIAATVMLGLGTFLWIHNGFIILSYFTTPRKIARKHRKVQKNGQAVKAQILDVKKVGTARNNPVQEVVLEFLNLTGNRVRAKVTITDRKPYENRLRKGKYLGLKLNRDGVDPPLTVSDEDYLIQMQGRFLLWFIFHFAYMIGFFLLSYHLHNDGYGWRFLSPAHPWIWSSIMSMVLLQLLKRGVTNYPIYIEPRFDLQSPGAKDQLGELLLHGRAAVGNIKNFSATGLHVNEQPQILFTVEFRAEGQLLTKSFKQVPDLSEKQLASLDEVEVTYLPDDPDVFAINFKLERDVFPI